MSEKFRLDRKIGFHKTFYTKCINVIIDSIGPSIILRSIYQHNCQSGKMILRPQYISIAICGYTLASKVFLCTCKA